MSSPSIGPTTRLMSMPLRLEQDVVLCRNHARAFSAALSFDLLEQVRIATAVSEIARNAYRYAREGNVEFMVGSVRFTAEDRGAQCLVVVVRDQGKGISELSGILNGTFRSESGAVTGITGARRLMDRVDFETGPGGTTVTLIKKLPAGKSVSPADLQVIGERISHIKPVSALEELAAQNRDLVRTLSELREQQKQLDTINSELSETNRGVVALYDELDISLARIAICV
ncbi:MAG: histidine kinase, partial [Verrucomicrobiaceae bacterium]